MPSNPSIRLAAWNVNSIKVRLPHVLQWLEAQAKAQTPIDVLCLQELKLTDDKFPHQELEQAGYWCLTNGQKTYNGVAILVRHAALSAISSDPETTFLKVAKQIPNFADEQRRILAATISLKEMPPIRMISAYMPNGQDPASDKFQYKLDWLQALELWLRDELQAHPRLVLMGDFNIAPEDRDVHDPKAWEGQNLVSAQEREQFQRLIQLGLHDSFRLFEQVPKSYSWWDYRMMAFRRNAGLRIDHILVSQALKDKCIASSIDKTPRAWEQPSDHAPVIVEIAKSS